MKGSPEMVSSHWLTEKIEGFCQTVAHDQGLPLDVVRGIAIGFAAANGDRGSGDAWVEWAVLTQLGGTVAYAFREIDKDLQIDRAHEDAMDRLDEMGRALAGPDPLERR